MKKLKEKKEKEVFLWPNFSTKTLQYCVNYQSWLLISSDTLKTKAWTYFGIASSMFTTSASTYMGFLQYIKCFYSVC